MISGFLSDNNLNGNIIKKGCGIHWKKQKLHTHNG